jgi:hypothetical protein
MATQQANRKNVVETRRRRGVVGEVMWCLIDTLDSSESRDKNDYSSKG